MVARHDGSIGGRNADWQTARNRANYAWLLRDDRPKRLNVGISESVRRLILRRARQPSVTIARSIRCFFSSLIEHNHFADWYLAQRNRKGSRAGRDVRRMLGNKIASVNRQPVTQDGNVLRASSDTKRRRRRKFVARFPDFGGPQPHLIVARAANRAESVRLEDEKGLDKKWHPVENRSAPVSAFPCCDVPPLRIAGIVCEETRWRKKKQ